MSNASSQEITMQPIGRTLIAALATALVVAPAAIAKPIELQQASTAAPHARDVARRNQSPTSSLAGTTSPQTVLGPPILRPSGRLDRQSLRLLERQGLFSEHRPSGRYSSADTNAYAGTARPVPATAPAIKASADDGFAYGDAAIGAGVGGAITLMIAAGSVTVRRRAQLQHS